MCSPLFLVHRKCKYKFDWSNSDVYRYWYVKFIQRCFILFCTNPKSIAVLITSFDFFDVVLMQRWHLFKGGGYKKTH